MQARTPLVHLSEISLAEANAALEAWGHRMGAFRRPNGRYRCHGLYEHDVLVTITITSAIVNSVARGGFSRADTGELARLCAVRPGLCRVMLRLWREVIWPQAAQAYGWTWAISYQDADIHTGNVYRFDGWKRITYSRGAPDKRSGRPGREKWVWCWHPDAVALKARPASDHRPVKRTPAAANDATAGGGDAAIAA